MMAESGRADSPGKAHREPRPRGKPHSYTFTDMIALVAYLASYAVVFGIVAAVGWWLFIKSVWNVLAACTSFCVKVGT